MNLLFCEHGLLFNGLDVKLSAAQPAEISQHLLAQQSAYQVSALDYDPGQLRVPDDFGDGAELAFVLAGSDQYSVSSQNSPLAPGKHGLDALLQGPHPAFTPELAVPIFPGESENKLALPGPASSACTGLGEQLSGYGNHTRLLSLEQSALVFTP